MKYKVGDFVRVLVQRECALEGDVGVIDAVHKDSKSYTVGFYAAEDCMVGNARFYEEELVPYIKEEKEMPFEVGDIVKALIKNLHVEEGRLGEIVSVYPKTKAVAVKFEEKDGGYPTILPYAFDEVVLMEKHHHDHH